MNDGFATRTLALHDAPTVIKLITDVETFFDVEFSGYDFTQLFRSLMKGDGSLLEPFGVLTKFN